MSEVTSLVSWQDIETLGKIPGSEWVCPTGDLKPLEAVHELGGTPTAEDITLLADGRNQHLDMIRFPEGYLAARIIDSETGQVLTDERAAHKYGGIFTCNCGAVHGACVTSVLSGNALPLEGGKELGGVYNFYDGTQTIIKPTEARDEPDYISRLRTGLRITPDAQSLHVYTEGEVGALPNGQLKVSIHERDGKTSAELISWLHNGYEGSGQVNLTFDSEGQPHEVSVYRSGFLDLIGVHSDAIEYNPHTGWAHVTDRDIQQQIVAGTAEALGMEAPFNFDVRQTASNLYAAIGTPLLDPATVLASQI